MAAALGGRKGVLRSLLAAAAEAEAEESGGEGPRLLPLPRNRRVALLVRAANRYGQTALHIAARRGCLESLEALLEAAGEDGFSRGDGPRRPLALLQPPPVAALRDASGDSAADVALRAGHFRAAALLSSAAAASACASASATSRVDSAAKVIGPKKWRPSENVLGRQRTAW